MKLLIAAITLFTSQAFAFDFTCEQKVSGETYSTSISSFPKAEVSRAKMGNCTGGICTGSSMQAIVNDFRVCGFSVNTDVDCTTHASGEDASNFQMHVSCPSKTIEFMLEINAGVGQAECFMKNSIVQRWELGSCALKP